MSKSLLTNGLLILNTGLLGGLGYFLASPKHDSGITVVTKNFESKAPTGAATTTSRELKSPSSTELVSLNPDTITIENLEESIRSWRRVVIATAKNSTPMLDQKKQAVQAKIISVITNELKTTYDTAFEQKTLKDSMAKWARAGAFLSMIPNDGSPDSAEIAQRLGFRHEEVKQEIMQRAQLQYNAWASREIRNAWVDLQKANNPFWDNDNQKFSKTCLRFLGHIDAGLLDIPTGQLFQDVLAWAKGKIDVAEFQTLVLDIQSVSKVGLDEERVRVAAKKVSAGEVHVDTEGWASKQWGRIMGNEKEMHVYINEESKHYLLASELALAPSGYWRLKNTGDYVGVDWKKAKFSADEIAKMTKYELD